MLVYKTIQLIITFNCYLYTVYATMMAMILTLWFSAGVFLAVEMGEWEAKAHACFVQHFPFGQTLVCKV